MESIKQKPATLATSSLPDFRNLGVILRLLLIINLFAALTTLIQHGLTSPLLFTELALMAGRVELPLFCIVVVLYGCHPWLTTLRQPYALAFISSITFSAVFLAWLLLASSNETSPMIDWLAWAGGAMAFTLLYFDYRNRIYSPALTEARLLALTARIRPHFLFNSLNGVLGIIRSDPKRAELALEELADLFRALMQDNRELVALGEEISLCERYINLEQLRLAERLNVHWDIKTDKSSVSRETLDLARVPPLLLQPLVENAVYHGIEPSDTPGEIIIRIRQRDKLLHLEVDNPVSPSATPRPGNQMALDNIRERLALFFDLEAGLEIDHNDQRYRVRIHLPFKRPANENSPPPAHSDRR